VSESVEKNERAEFEFIVSVHLDGCLPERARARTFIRIARVLKNAPDKPRTIIRSRSGRTVAFWVFALKLK
jgi:hypothetical protein